MHFFTVFICLSVSLITFGLHIDGSQNSLSRRKRFISSINAQIKKMRNCDQSAIPVMEIFNMTEFLGEWYELGKTVSNYIDVNDGVWKITESDTDPKSNKFKFLYSGRSSDEHCIPPISGSIKPIIENPGGLTLQYRTLTTSVSEIVRVLYTDYTSIAVLYACLHINYHSGGCHPAAVVGSMWTREPHVDGLTYDNALKYLDRACIDQHTIRIRNIVGPCEIDNLRIEDTEEADLVHDMCYQPMKTGSCFANIHRFYYDKDAKQCKEFTFTGCNGNKNNFFSLLECEHQCLNIGEKKMYPQCSDVSSCALHCPPCCKQTEDGCVLCDCQNIKIDEATDCHDVIDCPNNCKPEEIYSQCYRCICDEIDEIGDRSAVCLEVKQPGTCNDNIERYYYNAIINRCEKFSFSGCGGNKNNFLSLEECFRICEMAHRDVLKTAVSHNDPGAATTVHVKLTITITAFISALAFHQFSIII